MSGQATITYSNDGTNVTITMIVPESLVKNAPYDEIRQRIREAFDTIFPKLQNYIRENMRG